jgi:BirA family transcriptional regulator, biotin operon repressor / biotin---[acetyl-CoA-carboxylase] ligase
VQGQALADQLWAEVGGHLDTVVVLDAVDSTHAVALRLLTQADEGGIDLRPTLVIALRQSQGRGRGDNRWASPEGGLYLSWVRPGLAVRAVTMLPIIAGAATAASLAALGLAAVRVKWPNDLVVGGAKLGGILTHSRHGDPPWATVSIGVNLTVTPSGEELAGRRATSLAEHLLVRPWAEWSVPLVAGIVSGLEQGIADPEGAFTAWQGRLVHQPGEEIAVRLGSGERLVGQFVGLTDEGFLRLQVGDQERVVSSGELLEESGSSA